MHIRTISRQLLLLIGIACLLTACDAVKWGGDEEQAEGTTPSGDKQARVSCETSSDCATGMECLLGVCVDSAGGGDAGEGDDETESTGTRVDGDDDEGPSDDESDTTELSDVGEACASNEECKGGLQCANQACSHIDCASDDDCPGDIKCLQDVCEVIEADSSDPLLVIDVHPDDGDALPIDGHLAVAFSLEGIDLEAARQHIHVSPTTPSVDCPEDIDLSSSQPDYFLISSTVYFPVQDFRPGCNYTATVDAAMPGPGDTTLGEDYTWSFDINPAISAMIMPESCQNGTQDSGETGTDCGGQTNCPRCGPGETCAEDTDCNPQYLSVDIGGEPATYPLTCVDDPAEVLANQPVTRTVCSNNYLVDAYLARLAAPQLLSKSPDHNDTEEKDTIFQLDLVFDTAMDIHTVKNALSITKNGQPFSECPFIALAIDGIGKEVRIGCTTNTRFEDQAAYHATLQGGVAKALDNDIYMPDTIEWDFAAGDTPKTTQRMPGGNTVVEAGLPFVVTTVWNMPMDVTTVDQALEIEKNGDLWNECNDWTVTDHGGGRILQITCPNSVSFEDGSWYQVRIQKDIAESTSGLKLLFDQRWQFSAAEGPAEPAGGGSPAYSQETEGYSGPFTLLTKVGRADHMDTNLYGDEKLVFKFKGSSKEAIMITDDSMDEPYNLTYSKGAVDEHYIFEGNSFCTSHPEYVTCPENLNPSYFDEISICAQRNGNDDFDAVFFSQYALFDGDSVGDIGGDNSLYYLASPMQPVGIGSQDESCVNLDKDSWNLLVRISTTGRGNSDDKQSETAQSALELRCKLGDPNQAWWTQKTIDDIEGVDTATSWLHPMNISLHNPPVTLGDFTYNFSMVLDMGSYGDHKRTTGEQYGANFIDVDPDFDPGNNSRCRLYNKTSDAWDTSRFEVYFWKPWVRDGFTCYQNGVGASDPHPNNPHLLSTDSYEKNGSNADNLAGSYAVEFIEAILSQGCSLSKTRRSSDFDTLPEFGPLYLRRVLNCGAPKELNFDICGYP